MGCARGAGSARAKQTCTDRSRRATGALTRLVPLHALCDSARAVGGGSSARLAKAGRTPTRCAFDHTTTGALAVSVQAGDRIGTATVTSHAATAAGPAASEDLHAACGLQAALDLVRTGTAQAARARVRPCTHQAALLERVPRCIGVAAARVRGRRRRGVRHRTPQLIRGDGAGFASAGVARGRLRAQRVSAGRPSRSNGNDGRRPLRGGASGRAGGALRLWVWLPGATRGGDQAQQQEDPARAAPRWWQLERAAAADSCLDRGALGAHPGPRMDQRGRGPSKVSASKLL